MTKVTDTIHYNLFAFNIKYQSIIFKIRTFIDNFADLFETHIFYSVTFFCNWYMWRDNAEQFVSPDIGENTLYT